MENLMNKKNEKMVDGTLYLKGNKDQLLDALVNIVDVLGYDIYSTAMLAWTIKNRTENRISLEVRTDKKTWKEIKEITVKSLVATSEKAVAC